jgi:hypothetical protein
MKKIILTVLVTVVVVAGMMAGFNVYNAYADQQENVFFGTNGPGSRGTGMQSNYNNIANIPASDLSAEEEASLIFMVQEEQLARDVYNVMIEKWNITPFQNIVKSEQMHVDAVKQLLTRYEIADPSLEAGKFADPTLQKLYDDLIAQGSVSQIEALKVGALIEEVDIKDLQTRLATTDNADIQLIYTNLMNASNNHLRAYATNYGTLSGTVYTPSILSAEEFQAIMNSPMGRGNGNGMSNGMSNGMNCTGTQTAGTQGCGGTNTNSRQMGSRMGGRR